MSFEHYVRKGTKRLRYGYTTGTCAALASAAATRMLLSGEAVGSVSLLTPKGIEVDVDVKDSGFETRKGQEIPPGETAIISAWAGVMKDAGDDADITDGMMICAKAEKVECEGLDCSEQDSFVIIDGGKGVGRVTKAGLDQPVGNAAINSGPRSMIEEQVRGVCDELEYSGCIRVTVFVPEGEDAAKKTFNSNLGIEGGISILGTTGIVEPMSEQALVDTIELEMKQCGMKTDCLVMTPGNYGMHYIEEQGLDKLTDSQGREIPVLKFSNFLGETLDMLLSCGIRKVLLVGHAGKLVKVAAGVMNTHSSWADCRREVVCAHCAAAGGSTELCCDIMDAATTDAAFDAVDDAGLLPEVLDRIIDAIQQQLDRRAGDNVRIGAVLFSNERGTLGMSAEAKMILEEWR